MSSRSTSEAAYRFRGGGSQAPEGEAELSSTRVEPIRPDPRVARPRDVLLPIGEMVRDFGPKGGGLRGGCGYKT